MALPASGAISLANIQTEFTGSNPIGMNEYYRGGAYVTANNTSVPTSGQIAVGNFYGAVREFYLTLASNVQNANISTLATAAGWDGTAPLIVTVNVGVWLWSDSVATAGLIIPSISSSVTVHNYGKIIGRGSNGGGGSSYAACVAVAGGPAISNAASTVSLTNYSGAFIAGGGGGGGGAVQNPSTGSVAWAGGGGGAGGGVGGSAYTAYNGINVGGGAAGGLGSSGGNGGDSGRDNSKGLGGGAGGGGGKAWAAAAAGSGGGGGRILPGNGGAGQAVWESADGGTGGSNFGAGASAYGNDNIYVAGGGGGGWGASGGSGQNFGSYNAGGAGGAAISGTAVTLTNSGNIYGTANVA